MGLNKNYRDSWELPLPHPWQLVKTSLLWVFAFANPRKSKIFQTGKFLAHWKISNTLHSGMKSMKKICFRVAMPQHAPVECSSRVALQLASSPWSMGTQGSEEKSSHAANLTLLLDKDLEVLVDDGDGQQDPSSRPNGTQEVSQD